MNGIGIIIMVIVISLILFYDRNLNGSSSEPERFYNNQLSMIKNDRENPSRLNGIDQKLPKYLSKRIVRLVRQREFKSLMKY